MLYQLFCLFLFQQIINKMKHVMQSENDLVKLYGKWVLQVNSDTPDKTLMDYNWGFVREKRLFFVTRKGFADLYGNLNFESTFADGFEKVKLFFNSFLFDHMVKAGETDGGRFHRLLTSAEHDYLAKKLKEENF